MRKEPEILTLCKYPALLEDLNNLSIAIKAYYCPGIPSVASRYPAPTWPEVLEIIDKSLVAVGGQRKNSKI